MTAPPKNAIMIMKNRGAGRLRGSGASTLLPDADNAAVGSLFISNRYLIWAFPVGSALFCFMGGFYDEY